MVVAAAKAASKAVGEPLPKASSKAAKAAAKAVPKAVREPLPTGMKSSSSASEGAPAKVMVAQGAPPRKRRQSSSAKPDGTDMPPVKKMAKIAGGAKAVGEPVQKGMASNASSSAGEGAPTSAKAFVRGKSLAKMQAKKARAPTTVSKDVSVKQTHLRDQYAVLLAALPPEARPSASQSTGLNCYTLHNTNCPGTSICARSGA